MAHQVKVLITNLDDTNHVSKKPIPSSPLTSIFVPKDANMGLMFLNANTLFILVKYLRKR